MYVLYYSINVKKQWSAITCSDTKTAKWCQFHLKTVIRAIFPILKQHEKSTLTFIGKHYFANYKSQTSILEE